MSLKKEVDALNRQIVSLTALLESKDQMLIQYQKTVESLIEIPHADHVSVLKRLNYQMKRNLELDYSLMQYQFEKVHPDFYKILIVKYPILTPNDLRLATFIKMRFNNKEIAHIFNISHAGVKKSIQRFRKKINLGSKEDLRIFIEHI
jgi:succinate dehydrogenase flavin-adding protein (antitoxin of CptAB toxin-antitoxin module)